MMTVDDVFQWFVGNGAPLEWRREFAADLCILRPPAGTTLDLGAIEVGIVLPDMHLGWGNDVFTFNDPNRKVALEGFLQVLASLRDTVGPTAFRAIQLGDYYDFWRSPGVTSQQARAMIEDQYRGVIDAGLALPLAHCIGNHDCALVNPANRPPGMDVQIVQPLGSHSIMCFHGHDAASLQAINVNGLVDSIGLKLVSLLSDLPIAGPVTDWVQRIVDDSVYEPWLGSSDSKPWGRAVVAGPPGWSAPWVDRVNAIDLGGAVRGIELCMNQRVQIAIVGHSHRPGISWCPITANRRAALVDVGSWTYGRKEFAIVCADGLGLVRLQ